MHFLTTRNALMNECSSECKPTMRGIYRRLVVIAQLKRILAQHCDRRVIQADLAVAVFKLKDDVA